MRYCILYIVLFFSSFFCFVQATPVDSLIIKYETLKNQECDSVLFGMIREIFKSSNDPDVQLKYIRKAYLLGEVNNQRQWCAYAKFHEGLLYGQLNDVDSAIIAYQASSDLYTQDHNKKGIGSCKINLAHIYKINKDYIKAEQNLKDAQQLFLNPIDTFRLIAIYNNLGELFRIRCECDSALKYYNLAANQLQGVSGFVYYSAYVQGNIGLVYEEQNKLDSAKMFLQNAIQIFDKIDNKRELTYYLNGLSEVYIKERKFEDALRLSRKSLQIAIQYKVEDQIMQANLLLSDIYEGMLNYEKAYTYHRDYMHYRDSINNEETIRNIADLHTKYEIAKKQEEVDDEKSQKDFYLVIMICLVIVLSLLFIITVILLKRNKERRNANVLLEIQRNELAQANNTKNKFFSVLSHDLRSPLATFSSYAEILEVCIQQQDYKKLKVICTELQSNSNNLLDLLDNLLQWGVNQMNEHKDYPAFVKIKEVVLVEVNHLYNVSRKKEIAIEVSIPEHLTLFVDRVAMTIAIRNLINNALKFTPSGGKVTIDAYTVNYETIIEVSDTGVGMPESQIENLLCFDEVTSTYGTQKEKGVGLGLQLVASFVEKNNAEMNVVSQLGEGTTFILKFKAGSKPSYVKCNKIDISSLS